MKIRMASALTKPVMTERETYLRASPKRSAPQMICNTPVSTVAARRYCSPCSLTKVIMSSAIAPVAAEIRPGRPPRKAVTTAMQTEAYRPTCGSTPAMMEKAIASGTSAKATTSPAKRSRGTLPNQSLGKFCRFIGSACRP